MVLPWWWIVHLAQIDVALRCRSIPWLCLIPSRLICKPLLGLAVSTESPKCERASNDDDQENTGEKSQVILRVESEREPKESINYSCRNYEAPKPDMNRSKLCSSVCLFVNSVMHETHDKLGDHGDYNDNANDLMRRLEAFGL